MKQNYGIPYMGSKSKILFKLCKLFPKSENFYDLFGGGFSVTHFMAMNRRNDYKQFHFNEIISGVVELVQNAINGKYSYDNFKPEFISSDKFHELKEKDAYIKSIWSFGNTGKCYLFGKDVESFKRSIHNAIIFNRFDKTAEKLVGIKYFDENYSIKQRRSYWSNRIQSLNKEKSKSELQQLKQLQRLEQLERLERLQQLQQLHQLERLQQLQQLDQKIKRIEFYNTSYENVKIKNDSVIYCDIPYIGTAEYDKNNKFNHKLFYQWALDQKSPVFISEYTMPEKHLRKIYSIKKRSMLSSNCKNLIKDENVYVNEAGYKSIISNILRR